MVFESVISNLLNTYLNEFIDDLSANQLKVGAFSGNVELSNLAIRGNAFDALNLPFRVVYGHIGKFTAKIPWVSLYTSPVVFDIQKVYILCVPNVDSKYDEEAERRQFEADKKKQLLGIEEAWKTADLKDKGIEAKTSDDFVSKLVAQIAKNLEIRLEDVHICYEDKFTKPKCPFSLGLTLKRLTFVTLDSPTPKYEATNKENCFEKGVTLQYLSVYWNCAKDLRLISTECDGDLQSTFQSLIASENISPQLSYILRPSNFTAKTWINRKPVEDDYCLPMFDIEMSLDQFNLTLNRGQIQSFFLLLDSLDHMKLAGPYRKWRPNQPIMENPSAWWRFVITSILETQIRQKSRVWSWSYIKAHRKLLKEYKEVYMKYLESGRKTGQHVVEDIERRLDVFNIVLVRSRAKVDLDKKIAKQEQEKSERGGWFSWIYGGSSKKQDTQDAGSGAILDELKKEMTADEKMKLYQAIGYEESVPAEYPESYEAYLLQIVLLKINVSIHDESVSNDIVCFVLDNVLTQLGYRPTSNGARVKLNVHDIDFKGQGGNELIINKIPEEALLELEAETNPLTKEFDYGVAMKTRGIDFVCHTPTLYSLLDVLTPDEDLSLNQIQALAQIKLDQFKMMSVSGLEYAIEKHARLKIDIIIKPSYIVVPDHGCLMGCNDVLILSAGEMKISSSPTQQQAPNVRLKYQDSGEEELMKAMREKAYEKFKLSISRTQLILTSGDEWQGDLNSAKIEKDVTSTSHLIQPFGLDLNLMRSVVADDPEIPRMRIEGEVPPIFFRARNYQLCRLANLLLNIPTPDRGETLIVPEATFESQEVNKAKAETDALKIAHETAETLAEQDKPAFQVTNLVMNFSIEGLFCDLRMDDDRELLKFCVQKLGTEVQMKTFDTLANLYLGSILVEVRDLDSPGSTSFKILETPKSMNLLQIKYQLINRNGPTFNGVVQNIELIIAQIRLSIDSPILDELLIYSQKILDSLPSTTQTDRANTSRRLSISSQVSASLIQTITAKPKNRSAPDEGAEKILNLKTLVRMDSVVLSIGGICSTTLDGLEANLSLFESGVIAAKAQWNDFKVVNCVEDAATSAQKSRKLVHPTIIESQSERVLEMEVCVYPPEIARTMPGSVDVKCSVHFGRLKIVFLNEFVSRLVSFLTVFENAKQRALAASSRAASLAKQTAVSALESATRIGLDIVLEAPVIIVPRNWESTTCLLIDLGQIVIRNAIKRIQTSLIDQIKCELSNFKVSASDIQSEQSNDVQDDLIHPISFILEADRNLTFETNKKKPEIELKATLNNIQLSISQFNLMLLMSILSENLAEGSEAASTAVVIVNEASQDNLTLSVPGKDGRPKKKEKSKKLQKITASSLELSPSVSSSRIVEEAEVHVDAPVPKESKIAEVFIRYLLSFSMPKVDLVLYQAEKKTDVNRLTRAYLAGFDIYCRVMTNDSINASVTLSDIVLEDERRSKRRKLFKRLMFCNEYIQSSNSGESKTMRLEFIKEKDTKVDIEMSGFTLIFALDYLMQISEMLTASLAGLPRTTKLDYRPKVSKIKEIAKSSKNFVSDHSIPSPVDSPLMTFSFKMSQGDIILIESAERANPPAIVFNSLMNIDVKMKDDVINLGGSIRQIQLGMTNLDSYQKKRKVENYIVTPFRINILGEMTGSHSQHINIEFISQHKSHGHDHSTDIGLIISPNTVQVVLSILSALGQKSEEEKSESDEDEQKLEADLFTPKPIGDWKKWGFLMSGISEAVEATEDMFLATETNDEKPFILQQLVVTMESVSVTVESGGTDSRPLIKLFSSHVVILENWNKLKLRTACFMEYRNEKTFAWEPIIETINGRPWDFELVAKILQDKESGSKITASLQSKDQLELCMSKSAVDVVSGLGQSFKNAYKQPDTPLLGKNLFEFSNFTGMDLKIEVDVQKFSRSTHEQVCLLPTDQTKLTIEIKQGETVTLNKIRESSNENENQIVCTLSHLNHTITRRLCLRGNERRCFLFPCMSQPGEEYKWIFDLSQQDSRCKKVIFGTNVSVTNHFDVPLRLYHITSGGLDELTFLHEIKPDDTYFLPVDIIFVRNKYQCIFVKPSDDYCTPGEAITWGPDLQKVLSFATVKCESKKREPNFYIRIKRETQQMIFEDSTKMSSDCRYYKFHLYPVMRLRNLLPMKIEMTTILMDPENISRTATIIPGQANNVYHLDLEKNHKIVLKIPEYLGQEWICENRIPHSKWNKDGESITWNFASSKGKSLDLAINFNTKEEGCRVASLFAPFWMINKTGKKLIYKMGDAMIEHPPSIDVPILLCFKGKTSSSKKKLSLAIDKSEFSDAFSIDAAGNRGNIIARGGGHNYCASVETELSEFRLTNIVKFSPFYSVINKSSMDLDVSEDNKNWVSVGSKSSRSLWPDTQGLCQIFFRLPSNTSEPSEPITLKEHNSTLLRVGDRLIVVNVDITENSVVIQLTNYFPGSAPVRIFNALEKVSVHYGQNLVSIRKRVPPLHSAYFAWYDPSKSPLNLIWSTIESGEVVIDFSKDSVGTTAEGGIHWACFMYGQQRILLITKDQALAQATLQQAEFIKPYFDLELTLKGIGISLVDDELKKEVAYIGITSSEILWEVRKERSKRFKPFSVKEIEALENVFQKTKQRDEITGVLLIPKTENKPNIVTVENLKVDLTDPEKMKLLEPYSGVLRRSAASGVWLAVSLSQHVIQFHMKVHRVQIDNQMDGCVFPIVMCPVSPPRSLTLDRAPKAFFEISTVVQMQMSMLRFNYIQLLIQELLIQIDGDFLLSLLEFTSFAKPVKESYERRLEKSLKRALEDTTDYTETPVSSKNYFDSIHFSPIKAHVSFNLGDAEVIQFIPVIDFLLRSAGVTLTEFREVLFKIDYFERKNVLYSYPELVYSAIQHYMRQVLKQFYVIVLGLDVIGNPVGLVLGLKQGVGDLFYEPFIGIVEGPEEFAEGLALGVRSLVSHTVGGAAGALGKITGTLGDGISTLTMDQESRRKRRERINRKPTFAESGANLFRGLATGITGVVTKPVKGAQKEGFEGLVKGLGRGVVGIVADPVTGAMDFASGSLNALQRVVDVNTATKRQRPTRHFHSDGILRSFNMHEAVGRSILREVEKGRFVTDHYQSHFNLTPETVFMITDNRILSLKQGCMSKSLDLDWHETIDNIESTQILDHTQVLIRLASAKRKMGGLLSSEKQRLVTCPKPEMAKLIDERIRQVKRSGAVLSPTSSTSTLSLVSCAASEAKEDQHF